MTGAHQGGGEMFDLAAGVLDEYLRSGRRPRDLLAAQFAAVALPPSTRQQIAETVYRTVQQQRRLEHATGPLGGVPTATRAGLLLLAQLVADGALSPNEAAQRARTFGRLRIDWGGIGALDERIAAIDDEVTRLGVQFSVPDWVAARFRHEFAADAAALMAALNASPPRTIRANLLRVADRTALAEELAAADVTTTPTHFAPQGLQVAGAVNLFELDAFRRGAFEQQDEASQLCAEVVAPPPRGRILDACCGGGGKTLALAALLRNRGEILATDVHDGRLAELVERRRRAGVDVVRSLVVAADTWPAEVVEFARRADRILLDVPCSGVGSWRRRPDARWSLTAAQCVAMHAIQRDLLDRALTVAAPGARVVYATCTTFADENEQQIEAALERHPGVEVVPIGEILGGAVAAPLRDASGRFLRLWPHRHGTDGFFAAVLRRPRWRATPEA